MPAVQERAAAPHRCREPHASRDKIYSADGHTCAQCRHASPPACSARGLPLMSPIRIAQGGLIALIANLLVHLARIVADDFIRVYPSGTFWVPDKKDADYQEQSEVSEPKSLKKIEGRIEVEASVPLGFCVALGTVRRPKFMKSVCLVVQTKGGATLFTTRPCRVLCDKQVASGPRKKALVRATPGPGAPAGHLVMHALLPAPNPGSMTVTEAPKLQSVHALVERHNQVAVTVASVPLHDHAPGAVVASLPSETVESQGNRGAVASCSFPRSAAAARARVAPGRGRSSIRKRGASRASD